MKKDIFRFSVLTALVVVAGCFMITFSGCKDENTGPTSAELFTEKISHSWQVERVTLDGREVTNAFPGMQLTINSDFTYTTINPVAPVWKASGTFQLQETANATFNLLRDDGALMIVTDLNSATWKLKFPYTSASGRSQSVSGQYEFTFKVN